MLKQAKSHPSGNMLLPKLLAHVNHDIKEGGN